MTAIKYSLLFVTGGAAYAMLEIACRGRTHWTMFLAGGLCFLFLYWIAINSPEPLWKKAIMGGIIITTVEFLVGGVVNIGLHWEVWDYSHHKFNLFGQICPMFSVMWTGLSVPAIGLCQIIEKLVFRR